MEKEDRYQAAVEMTEVNWDSFGLHEDWRP
jgi:hypothetical protein